MWPSGKAQGFEPWTKGSNPFTPAIRWEVVLTVGNRALNPEVEVQISLLAKFLSSQPTPTLWMRGASGWHRGLIRRRARVQFPPPQPFDTLRLPTASHNMSGCRKARAIRLAWNQENGGSNPPALTKMCGAVAQRESTRLASGGLWVQVPSVSTKSLMWVWLSGPRRLSSKQDIASSNLATHTNFLIPQSGTGDHAMRGLADTQLWWSSSSGLGYRVVNPRTRVQIS